ncbi:unnamed protein product [Acanthosepion pharaonis]|uniref:Uncharacterized protein n=1 Tax=Acanthosepion pharaonis TaxID=158019 RepID=A0A812BLE4_ACAPH|nr:unnamed protein product [Sepia pharaonis]
MHCDGDLYNDKQLLLLMFTIHVIVFFFYLSLFSSSPFPHCFLYIHVPNSSAHHPPIYFMTTFIPQFLDHALSLSLSLSLSFSRPLSAFTSTLFPFIFLSLCVSIYLFFFIFPSLSLPLSLSLSLSCNRKLYFNFFVSINFSSFPCCFFPKTWVDQ